MKTKLTMKQVYAEVAACFRDAGNLTPTHCDVRCAVNDYLNWTAQDNADDVRFDYSQDAAFRTVRKLLSS